MFSKKLEEESAQEKLERLKRELQNREEKPALPEEPSNKLSSSLGNLPEEFDDEDQEDSDTSSENEKQSFEEEEENTKLKKELERIKSEKRQRLDIDVAVNPLLETETSINRRWDDDKIFRNQAKREAPKVENQIVNDTLRSSKHKDFLKKHIM